MVDGAIDTPLYNFTSPCANEYTPWSVVIKVLAVTYAGTGFGASLGVSKSTGSEKELLLLQAVTEKAVAQTSTISLLL